MIRYAGDCGCNYGIVLLFQEKVMNWESRRVLELGRTRATRNTEMATAMVMVISLNPCAYCSWSEWSLGTGIVTFSP